MKKILLLAAIAATALGASAQVEFTYEGNVVKDGDVIYANMHAGSYDATVIATAAEEMEASAKMCFDGLPTAEQYAEGGMTAWGMPQLCIGMNCYPSNGADNVSGGSFTLETTGTQYLFHCLFAPQDPTWKSQYKVVTKAGDFQHAFTIVFDNAAGVEGILNENAPAEYFNLQGVRVANPENGLFIVKEGNKVSKRVIR